VPNDHLARFQRRLVLAAYLRQVFGARDASPAGIGEFYGRLADSEGNDSEGVSRLTRGLQARPGVGFCLMRTCSATTPTCSTTSSA